MILKGTSNILDQTPITSIHFQTCIDVSYEKLCMSDLENM